MRVKTHPQLPGSAWKANIVLKRYLVDVNGRKYRRHRIHLRDTVESRQTQSSVPSTDVDQQTTLHASSSRPLLLQTAMAQAKDRPTSHRPTKDEGHSVCNGVPQQPSDTHQIRTSCQTKHTTKGFTIRLCLKDV